MIERHIVQKNIKDKDHISNVLKHINMIENIAYKADSFLDYDDKKAAQDYFYRIKLVDEIVPEILKSYGLCVEISNLISANDIEELNQLRTDEDGYSILFYLEELKAFIPESIEELSDFTGWSIYYKISSGSEMKTDELPDKIKEVLEQYKDEAASFLEIDSLIILKVPNVLELEKELEGNQELLKIVKNIETQLFYLYEYNLSYKKEDELIDDMSYEGSIYFMYVLGTSTYDCTEVSRINFRKEIFIYAYLFFCIMESARIKNVK